MSNRLYVFQVGTEVMGVTAERFALACHRVEISLPLIHPVIKLVFSTATPENHEVPVNFSELEKEV
jgi:hypothetical protein